MSGHIQRLHALVEKNKGKWLQTGRGFCGPREGFKHYQLGACTFESDAELVVAAVNSQAALLAIVDVVQEQLLHAEHPTTCMAVCGPPGEEWLEEEKCTCHLKKLRELITNLDNQS